jgi:CrcB protein
MKALLAVFVGAGCGALLRWWLGLWLNSLYPSLPPGTLTANLVGAFIIGVAMAAFAMSPSISMEWRVLITTGFCGGLTTFSAFSAEIVTLLQQGRASMALLAVGAHLGGSLLMTFAGIAAYTWVRRQA